MATIASLDVFVGANVGSFTAGLSKAASALTGLSAGPLAIVMDQLSKLGQTIVSTVNDMDSIGDASANLGSTTEAVTRLQFAAEKLGGSEDGMLSALQKLQKNLPEVAKGGTTAAKAVEKLGLDTTKFSQLDPASAFNAVAAAFDNLKSDTDKAEVAYALFGRGAKDIISTLEAGTDAIGEQTKRADELGYTLTSVEAMAGGSVKDAFFEMQAALKSIAQTLVTELAPALKSVTDFFTGLIQKAQEAWRFVKKFVLPEPLRQFLNAHDAVAAMTPDGGSSTLATKNAATIRSAVEAMDEVGEAASNAFRDATGPMQSYYDELERRSKQQAKLVKERLAWEKDKQEKLRDAVAAVWESTRTPAEIAAREFRELEALLDQRAISMEMFERAALNIKRDLEPEERPDLGAGAAVLAGTSEGITELIKASLGRERDKDVPRQSLDEQRRQRDLLTKIERHLSELAGDTVTVGAA